jgi:DNA-directed RNA polymerase subunit RPC12/RpoP
MDTISFRCQSCQQPLKIAADKAGRRVKCRKCGTVLTVPASQSIQPETVDEPALYEVTSAEEGAVTKERKPGSPVARRREESEGAEKPARKKRVERRDPEPEEDENEVVSGKQRRRQRKAAWRKVRLGITLLIAETALSVVLAVAMILWGWIGGVGGLLSWIRFSFYFGLVLMLLGSMGYGLCAFVPNERGTRHLAFAVLALGPLGSLLNQLLNPQFNFDPEAADFAARAVTSLNRFAVLAVLLQLIAYVRLLLVPLFFRSLAATLKDKDLGTTCESFLQLSGFLALFLMLVVLVLRFATGFPGLILIPLGCGSGILGIAWWVWYVVILLNAHASVGARAD